MAEIDAVERVPGAGAAIRAARRDRGLKLAELAGAIGVSIGTMSAIENEKVGLTVGRLRAIAAKLDMEPARLVEGEPVAATVLGVGAGGGTGGWRTFEPLDLDPVLVAAVQVFRDTGYHGATMRLIAASAGSSVAGIYHYHRSKHSLLAALVEIVMDDLAWRVSAAAAEANQPVGRFQSVVEALTLFHSVRSVEAFVVATELRSLHAAELERTTTLRRSIQRVLNEAAADAVRDGAFRSSDVLGTARAVASMCMSLPYWYSAGGSRPAEVVAAEHVRLATLMMEPSPSS